MRALLVLAVFLSACETTWREGASITPASGQRLCAKHRVALVPLRAWRAPTRGDRVYLVHDANHPYYGVAEQYCPNHIPEHISFARGDIFQERTIVYYCPPCETEFRERLRVPDEKAAIAFAKYVLGIRSDAQTRGPYHVSLDNGVWTVRCFLADGRAATVKIGKEEGTEISTKFRRYSSNQAMQRTARKAAIDVLRVRHPRFGCESRFTGLAVADLVSR